MQENLVNALNISVACILTNIWLILLGMLARDALLCLAADCDFSNPNMSNYQLLLLYQLLSVINVVIV